MVVETDIHYPTDSTLLEDGVRVLTRTMTKITKIVGAVGTKLRDRSRSVKFRPLEIGRIARAIGQVNRDKLKQADRLLNTTSWWWGRPSQAKPSQAKPSQAKPSASRRKSQKT